MRRRGQSRVTLISCDVMMFRELGIVVGTVVEYLIDCRRRVTSTIFAHCLSQTDHATLEPFCIAIEKVAGE